VTGWLDRVTALLESHAWVLWSLVGLSLATLVLSVVLVPILVARIPADFYVRERDLRRRPGHARAWLSHWVIVIAKNTLGLVLLVAGAAMLFLPGQGLLTILAGLALVDFPYKRELELRLLRAPAIARVVGWLRRRAGEPPLRLS